MNELNIEIVIRDNGIGLVNNHQPLSKAFVTTKENGLGLGLAICRDVIEDHNGTFLLQSAQPQGCQVTVTLPITDHNSAH